MAPPFNPDIAPVLDATDWPTERLQKANRNYAMEYAKNALLELAALFGPADAAYLGGITSQLIGKQYYRQTADSLSITGESPEAFADFMYELIDGQDDQATITVEKDGIHITQTGWRLMRGSGPHPTSILTAGTSYGKGLSPSITGIWYWKYSKDKISATLVLNGASAAENKKV